MKNYLSSTFQKLQANTNEIWRFQRYRLVFEYFHTPSLPPPLVIFSHLFYIVRDMFRKPKRNQLDVADRNINQTTDDDENSLLNYIGIFFHDYV